ncbi:MAG: T9SS type A sorting domain-containing protein, partial [Thermoanaerobaculia bacterium]|nr:T9SS type A sorting domain-containing protein [Thermoanaerobaculia bacterium]
ADFCTIEFPGFLNDPARLYVVDASGKLVKTLTIAQQNSVLDLQEINGGLYYLKIEHNNRRYFQKLIIVR